MYDPIQLFARVARVNLRQPTDGNYEEIRASSFLSEIGNVIERLDEQDRLDVERKFPFLRSTSLIAGIQVRRKIRGRPIVLRLTAVANDQLQASPQHLPGGYSLFFQKLDGTIDEKNPCARFIPGMPGIDDLRRESIYRQIAIELAPHLVVRPRVKAARKTASHKL